MTKVLFPDASVVIHERDRPAARILHPGQYVAIDDLPDYQQEAALAGRIPHSRVIDKDSADALLAEAERVRNLDNPESEFKVGPVVLEEGVLDQEFELDLG